MARKAPKLSTGSRSTGSKTAIRSTFTPVFGRGKGKGRAKSPRGRSGR